MRTPSKAVLVALAAASLAASACTGPSARMKDEDEGTLVDVRRGGTETWKELIRRSVDELLAANRERFADASEKPAIAFIGVQNKGSEELGEFKAAVSTEITTALVNSGIYRNVSVRLVQAAQRETGIRQADDLVVARHREAFMACLNRDGITPKFFVFGTVTTMTSRGNSEMERTYQLTLEMMNSSSGETVTQKTVEVRKAYE